MFDTPHEETSDDQDSEPSGPFSRATLATKLNPGQLEAACYPPKPLLVVAGAGSGKTRVITYRLARLLAGGANPRRILVVTFTNKAAAELRARAARILGATERDLMGLWIGTFHGISARLLRRYPQAAGLTKDFVIYDTDDQRRLMTRLLSELKVNDKMFPPRQVLSEIDRAKNLGIGPDAYAASSFFEETIARAYKEYEKRLSAANAVDFGGLLMSALGLCHRECPVAPELYERFDHVMVDEFQDTNNVQYRLVRFLSQRSKSITVVGDEDQSIYKWRGADIRNILDFERDHAGAGTVKLEQNYRSSGNVLRAANAIIARNTERRPKRLFTEEHEGDPIVVFEGDSERDEADYVAQTIDTAIREGGASPRDFAIFYRTNGQSRVIEEAMRGRDLPYVVVGGTRFYDRAEIKDLLSYLRVLLNPADDIGLLRIVNTPARGIGDTTVDKVVGLAQGDGITLDEGFARACTHDALLGAGPRKKVMAFVEMMANLRAAAPLLGPAALAEKILEDSGYRDMLAAEASLEAEGRMENLLELVGQMRDFERDTEDPTLSGFLERVALASDVDGYDPEKGAVSLMTVHTAKGLEFPWVFVTGMEENIFPHARSQDDDSAMEEERRLCYVAVTRAMRRLYLTRVRRRRLGGQTLFGPPSRFLRDVPTDASEQVVQARPAYMDEDSGGAGAYGGGWNRGGGGLQGRGQAAKPTRPDPARTHTDFSHLPPPPSKPAPAPGIQIHYDDDAGGGDELGLRIGARLRHPQFGVGEVRGWQGLGHDLKVTVKFGGAGVKTVLARFLSRG